MNELIDPITALADFFSGPEVGRARIGLQMPDGPMRKSGERFFAIRKVFGIDGYDSRNVCERKILAVLRESI